MEQKSVEHVNMSPDLQDDWIQCSPVHSRGRHAFRLTLPLQQLCAPTIASFCVCSQVAPGPHPHNFPKKRYTPTQRAAPPAAQQIAKV